MYMVRGILYVLSMLGVSPDKSERSGESPSLSARRNVYIK